MHMQYKLFVYINFKSRGTLVINYHPSFNMKIEGPLHPCLRPGILKPLRANQVRDTKSLADHYTHLLLRPGTTDPRRPTQSRTLC